MNLSPQSHFSGKVLLLSIIFLASTLGIHVVRYFTLPQDTVLEISPILSFEPGQKILLKQPYASEFSAAVSGQTITSDTEIKTTAGQEAELMVGKNKIRLQEETWIKLAENNVSASTHVSEAPRLTLELDQGGIWVDAFDSIRLKTKRAEIEFHHSVGILTYTEPLNRLMVLTGDASLSLLGEDRKMAAQLMIPLGNQVTFVDSQITEIYPSLKPSKLKKELKTGALSANILMDDWIQENILAKQAQNKAENKGLIHSSLVYHLKNTGQKAMSWFSFRSGAEQNIARHQIEIKLNYILGKLKEDDDRIVTKEMLETLQSLVVENLSQTEVITLLRTAFYQTEAAEFATPDYLVREFLLDQLEALDGPILFRVYLTDLRKLLNEGDIKLSEAVLKKWEEKWKEEKIASHHQEYQRQTQILYQTILSQVQLISVPLLDIFDGTGVNRMTLGQDQEEARFEVAQERLQLTSSLIEAQRYVLAKQYLKNSYLSLKIEDENQNLPSTQIFLETGRLLAQRLDFADKILRNANELIDETKFLEYLQSQARDKALTSDLKAFFELEQQKTPEAIVASVDPQKVAEQFLAAGARVEPANIKLINSEGFLYQVSQATLVNPTVDGRIVSFAATYDFITTSVTEVKIGEKNYKGPFLLTDLVNLLQSQDQTGGTLPLEAGDVSLLISNEQQAEALQGQAVASDLAIKLAVNKLTEAGIVIKDLKLDIQVIDPVNLDKFKISRATTDGMPTKEGMSFNYFSTLSKVTDVRNSAGALLFKESALSDLAARALIRFTELEKEKLVIQNFENFSRQNDLTIDTSNIVYTTEDLLLLTDLKIDTLGLSVTGLYDTKISRFLSVKHKLLNSDNITIKDYFDQLADLYLTEKLKEKGIGVMTFQIETIFPFRTVKLKNVLIGQKKFDFSLNVQDLRPINIRDLETGETLGNMSFEELRAYGSVVK